LSDVPVTDIHKKSLEKYCTEIHVYSINGKINLLRNALSKAPFQVNYFYNSRIHKKINMEIERIAPDHIYFQLLRMYPYRNKAHDTSVSIDMMDSFSVGYKLRSNQENGLMSWLYNKEANRLVALEKEIIQALNCKFIISAQDKKSLVPIDDDQLHIIPNGIDTQFFQPKVVSQKKDILFVGNMGYKPNIYATEFLVEKIFPLVKQLRKDTTLTIAGARPTSKILSYRSKQIAVTGWVEDIRAVYNEHKIFVAPIFNGIGQQNKILEAMAMEIPCIVSPEVASGLDIDDIEQYLTVASNEQEFADYILQMLASDADTTKKVLLAKENVVTQRSWKAKNKMLEEKILAEINRK
jgi:glycosyltransferase involved in cell wall biosynthesis